jgi:GntR family transcriptional regulator, transcriptional repressor for pyruvate dehydrogenase complex
VIERIERATLGETVLDRLGKLIRSGAFPPGSRLPPERELADGFDVARGPVREALRALALAGLVDIRPGHGTFVRDPLPAPSSATSLAQAFADQANGLREVYDARRLIETELYVLATGRLTAEDLSKLEDLLHHMRMIEHGNGDRQEFARAHYEFDAIIAEAANNGVLLYIFRQLRDVKVSAHEQMLRVPAAMHISNVQHEKLLAALRSRQRDEVSRAAQEHYAAAEHFLDAVGAPHDDA